MQNREYLFFYLKEFGSIFSEDTKGRILLIQYLIRTCRKISLLLSEDGKPVALLPITPMISLYLSVNC